MKKLFTILFFLLSYTFYGQGKYLPMLEIKKNESYTFLGDTLVLDTLKMHDKSKLFIINDPVTIVVRNAFVLGGSTIDATGTNGQDGISGTRIGLVGEPGYPGVKGKDITLYIHFVELGELKVVTRGGKGGAGGNGAGGGYRANTGEPGRDGMDGGACGNGGKGGNIVFNYSSEGFIPIFNRKGRGDHKIFIDSSGGASGRRGRGGYKQKGGPEEIVRNGNGEVVMSIPAGADGRNGRPGAGCSVGAEGEIVINKTSF